MPYERRRSRSRTLRRKVVRALGIVVGLAALAGVWWWLAQLGPKRLTVESEAQEVVTVDSDLSAMRAEIAALADAIGGEESPAAVGMLEEAVTKQQALVARLGSRGSQADVRRLRELEEDLDSARAQGINPRIEFLMTKADAARSEQAWKEAEAAWLQALELQQQINRSGASSLTKSFVRESRIEQALQELAAQPLAEEVREAMQAARAAVKQDEWADALAAFSLAREVQLRINADFPRSPSASLNSLDEIEREISSLDAAGVAAEVDTGEAAGDLAMEEARYEDAVKAFEAARQAQLRLNREFSRSRFLSSPRVERLEVKRQTASSVLPLQALQAEMKAINQLLIRRESTKALERINAASEKLEMLFEQLSKSERLDPALRLRLGFLASQSDRIAEIQDTVYDRLRPLPGVAELQLLRTELPQSLYLQVMRANPSRHPGREFPVDSVNWFDAMSFCERLSWIMGRTARLPTADEFRIAVGDPAVADLPESVSVSESAAMASRQPNAAGFFDLLGNIAEWLAPRPAQPATWSTVAGGSYLDGVAALREVPYVDTERTARARHIGFRVVVEFPPD